MEEDGAATMQRKLGLGQRWRQKALRACRAGVGGGHRGGGECGAGEQRREEQGRDAEEGRQERRLGGLCGHHGCG